mmetsp:Transcript_78556/g.206199  ORF Transcript_78556/g.206199 Transcript_78556/m.206199 type:complete len:230 (+) Transcript_78556:293-982(+)
MACAVEPQQWHWDGFSQSRTKWPISPQFLHALPEASLPPLLLPFPPRRGGRSLVCSAWRHFLLRWPVLPQMEQVLSRWLHSATLCAVEPQQWHCASSGQSFARCPGQPQLLHTLSADAALRSALYTAWRHLLLRCPTLPQVPHSFSRFGQPAISCDVEPQQWHWASSSHWPAMWPTSPQLLHVFSPTAAEPLPLPLLLVLPLPLPPLPIFVHLLAVTRPPGASDPLAPP